MAGCTEQLTPIINAAPSGSTGWQQRSREKSQMTVRRSFGARPRCRHWERGAEPAQSLGLNHKHGCEASAVAEFCSPQARWKCSKGKHLHLPHLKEFLLGLDPH